MKRLHIRSFAALLVVALVSARTLVLAGAPAAVQTKEEVMSAIAQALQLGTEDKLTGLMNEHVEVVIDNKEESYTRSQATFVLRDFFRKNKATSFRFLHQGSTGDTHYGAGKYYTAAGVYDVNVFLKKVGSQYLIDQIMFQPAR